MTMTENPRVALRGVAQKKLFAITSQLGGASIPLSEIARDPSFRGIHYARIESAARELARKGYIEFDGVMVEEALVDRAAGVLGSRLNQFLKEGWRVRRWPEGQRVRESEALGPLPGAKVDQLKEKGVDLVRSFENPHGSFAGAGGYRETPARRTGLTAKGERMVRDIEADSSYGMDAPGIAYATVYARAKDRPGTGLVTQEWAREHGYPRPNPDMHPTSTPSASWLSIEAVIPARVWVHTETGQQASIYGAAPGPGWEMRDIGWTWRTSDGRVGIGRKPAKTKAEAEKVMREINAKFGTRRNPSIDLNKAGIEEMFDAIPRRGQGNRLWWFQFGPYTGTNVFVWGGYLEDGLEIAAGWLAENAPGHLSDWSDIIPLIREQLEERDPERYAEDSNKYFEEWQEAMQRGDSWAVEVEEAALADMTYTESGYLTSYEWYVNELNEGDEVYAEVWEATIDALAGEGDLDDDDIEAVNKFASKLDIDAQWELED